MVSVNRLLVLLLSIVLISCNTEDTSYSNSLISSPHPLASQAGKIIYSKGGNAYDAAVAAAFKLSVVEPSMSGIGGRLQVIYKQAEGGILGIDATTQIPESFKNEDEEFLFSTTLLIGADGANSRIRKPVSYTHLTLPTIYSV